ncbi:hypothetical protein [Budvicia diplopodorum]|uniref:LuxE/PaaK family acyltransferase n=1 Tax=Budvicia diplopodorum TaxID=1119056 RepID=UPI001FE3D498|nr:hypothetical protein [Budvicia diplopodorum]
MSDNKECMAQLTAIEMLVNLPSPYGLNSDANEHLFNAAMQQADLWHQSRNPTYAKLCDSQPNPVIPVGLFKTLNLATPVGGDGQWLNSSGTGNSGKTQVFFDVTSMGLIQRAMVQIFIHNGLVSPAPARFLLLSPDPSAGDLAGYATAFLKFTACAPVQECVFAVQADGRLDTELAWNTLQRWANEPVPIYIFGLTVFFEHLCLSQPAPFTLQAPVKGLTGGGWKGMTQRLDRQQIIAGLNQCLQAPLVDIRDIYGMTEHPLHYISCRKGHFHIPAYSRFSIINTAGLEAENSQPGLIQLENPFFASLPSHRLLTQDLGSWEYGCSCGLPGRFLRYIGRAASPEGTCAAEAI